MMRYFKDAANQVSNTGDSVRRHLTASDDPYVCFCPDVTVFRDSREQGFGFLEEPYKTHVVFTSMHGARPATQQLEDKRAKSLWYAEQADLVRLIERLNLLGFAALQSQTRYHTGVDDAESSMPVLVLPFPGTGSRHHRHPLESVLCAVREWRRRFSPWFHTIVIACKDCFLAEQNERVINAPYSTLAHKSPEAVASVCMPWHWDQRELAIGIHSHSLGHVATAFHDVATPVLVGEALYEQRMVTPDCSTFTAEASTTPSEAPVEKVKESRRPGKIPLPARAVETEQRAERRNKKKRKSQTVLGSMNEPAESPCSPMEMTSNSPRKSPFASYDDANEDDSAISLLSVEPPPLPPIVEPDQHEEDEEYYDNHDYRMPETEWDHSSDPTLLPYLDEDLQDLMEPDNDFEFRMSGENLYTINEISSPCPSPLAASAVARTAKTSPQPNSLLSSPVKSPPDRADTGSTHATRTGSSCTLRRRERLGTPDLVKDRCASSVGMSGERLDSTVFNRPASTDGIVARTGHFKNLGLSPNDTTLETLEEVQECAEEHPDQWIQHSLTEMSTTTSLHAHSGSDLRQSSSKIAAPSSREQPVVQDDSVSERHVEASPKAFNQSHSRRLGKNQTASVSGSFKHTSRSKASTAGLGGMTKYDMVLGSTAERLGVDFHNLNSEGLFSSLMDNMRCTQKASIAKKSKESLEVGAYEIRRRYRAKLADKVSKQKMSSKKATTGSGESGANECSQDVPEWPMGPEWPMVVIPKKKTVESLNLAEQQASEIAAAFLIEAQRKNPELHAQGNTKKDCVDTIRSLTAGMVAASQPKNDKGEISDNVKRRVRNT
eukprot:NODE_257_length_3273_cov_13.197076.p1 GENE.NODE_257_length_3273_cov_13.197076~~NODE_257_length_3273_cov_13.197076.p1  ORF type:complete len:833 (-),score=121.49 NODE_257_length_3273_cov_13.197076:444-2942(-)